MTITVVFDPPLPSDSPTVFNTKAFTLVGDLNTFATQVNAAIVTMNTGFADTIHAATLKATPIGADEFALIDTAAANTLKRLTWTQLLATAKTYFDTVYATGTGAAIRSLLGITTLSGSNTGDQTTITGNAGSATVLATARTINGVSFDGSANITVAAAAGTLSGATLAAGVTASSLTSVGTLASLGVTGAVGAGGVNVTSSTVPSNGVFLPSANVLGLSAGGALKMSIDSVGHMGQGIAPGAGVGYYQYQNASGAVDFYGYLNTQIAQSGVTASLRGMHTSLGTAAAAFTLANIYHILATQNTIGAGSIVYAQYGYYTDPSLVGASSNYGMYGNIPAAVAGTQTGATITAMSSSGTTVTVTATNSYTNGQTVTLAATANASALTNGCPVTILTMGTTSVANWQAIGATSGTVGESFTATGAGTGTGTVTLDQQGSGKIVAAASGTNFTVQSQSATYASVTLLTGSVTVSTRYNLFFQGDAPSRITGDLQLIGSGGLGYGTGAGGTVTQAIGRTTGVTLNKNTGAITLVNAAGSTTATSFTVTNSLVAATDLILLNQKSGTNKYVLLVTAVAAGSFQITVYTTGGTTTEQPVINFAIYKGASA